MNKTTRRMQAFRFARSPAPSSDGQAEPSAPGRRQVIQMAATITFTYPFSQDDIALLNKLLGATGGGANAPAGEFFPQDPGMAKFPSPEDSQILVFNGTYRRPALPQGSGGRDPSDQDGQRRDSAILQERPGVPGVSRRGRRPVPGQAGRGLHADHLGHLEACRAERHHVQPGSPAAHRPARPGGSTTPAAARPGAAAQAVGDRAGQFRARSFR